MAFSDEINTWLATTAQQAAQQQHQDGLAVQRLREAVQLWQELRTFLKATCASVKTPAGKLALRFDVCPNTEASIRLIDTNRALQLRFDAETPSVVARAIGTGHQDWLFLISAVQPDRLLLADQQGAMYTAEGIGKQLLEGLVGKR
jgi:hypothetical protein